MAFARLYGEPLFRSRTTSTSRPMRSRSSSRPSSPLDLLLYLIRKQNFNVLDIPMAQVTRQYLSYVEEIRKRNLELAAGTC